MSFKKIYIFQGTSDPSVTLEGNKSGPIWGELSFLLRDGKVNLSRYEFASKKKQ